jgi:virginiamycin B lyase
VSKVFNRKTFYVLGIVLLLLGLVFYATFLYSTINSCGQTLGSASVSRFNLQSVHFDGVTKYHLLKNEFPNGIAVAPDGSVWFGEQDVTGLGHLYDNGTMIEYRWPVNYAPSTTSIWGVAVWNGRIWASDALGGELVSLNPVTSALTAVKLSNVGAFPYTITIGPDNALWFTELYGSKLGRIDAQCKLAEYAVPKNFGGTPTQIVFQNTTLGYYADAGNATSAVSEILSFNVKQFAPQPIAGAFRPVAASSLALTPDGLWVAQHASSNLAYDSFQTHSWSLFPTTPVSYVETTLPYFVAANGSSVWFNEHYANRIGVIDGARRTLTEYSLSNPPANKTTQIDNALTFTLGGSRVWFTELTANYVGYIDATYKPSFSASSAKQVLYVNAGSNIPLSFVANGFSTKPLRIHFADSENYTSLPFRIALQSNETEISPLNGQSAINAIISTDPRLAPGTYSLLIALSNGLINQGVYVWLQVVH